MSPIRLNVSDPKRQIASVSLAYESADCVVLHIDLTASGKRETPAFSGRSVWVGEAEIIVLGLPFRKFFSWGETARHTCFVTFLKRATLARSINRGSHLYVQKKD